MPPAPRCGRCSAAPGTPSSAASRSSAAAGRAGERTASAATAGAASACSTQSADRAGMWPAASGASGPGGYAIQGRGGGADRDRSMRRLVPTSSGCRVGDAPASCWPRAAGLAARLRPADCPRNCSRIFAVVAIGVKGRAGPSAWGPLHCRSPRRGPDLRLRAEPRIARGLTEAACPPRLLTSWQRLRDGRRQRPDRVRRPRPGRRSRPGEHARLRAWPRHPPV